MLLSAFTFAGKRAAGLCFLLAVLLLSSLRAEAQTVDSITVVPPGPFCQGNNNITVYYRVTGLLSGVVTSTTAQVINAANAVVHTVTPAPANATANGTFSFTTTLPSTLTGANLRMRLSLVVLVVPFSNTSAAFTINPTTAGGTVSASQAICSGLTPSSGLTLSGHTGTVVKWQRSTSSTFASGVTDIANTTTTLSAAAIGPLTTTTYFRAVVQSGNCPQANSGAATITVNSPVFPVPTVTNVACNGGATGAVVAAATGTGAISYSISPAAGTQSPAGTFSNLPANTYTITASDAGTGCSATRTVNITQPALLSFSTAKTDVTSCIAANGTITVTATGGTGTYQYSNNNGSTYQVSNVFSNLAAGTYAIRVRDANNCVTAAGSVTINPQTSLPSVTGLNSINVTCAGGSNGSITFGAGGGSAPYSFSINNGSTYTSGTAPYTFPGLNPGSYQARVRDANGCQSQATTVTISTSFPKPNGALSGSTICEGQPGPLTFTASAGTGPFSLVINGNTYTNIQSGVPFNVAAPPLTNSNYTLTLITDVHGCTNP